MDLAIIRKGARDSRQTSLGDATLGPPLSLGIAGVVTKICPASPSDSGAFFSLRG